MDKIKLFLAEDSSLIRNLLTGYFKKSDTIELVDMAADGEEAIRKLATLDVDLIILDIVMPKLDGIETLKAIRKKNTTVPIIMYSSLTTNSSSWHTVEALTLGATDYCQKPVGFGGAKLSPNESMSILKDKIIALVNERRSRKSYAGPYYKAVDSALNKNYDLIVIGSSTGGPQALKTILSGLGGILPPILVTQHMPATFTKLLANNLDAPPFLNVKEGEVGDTIYSGNAYIAPGGNHMTLTESKKNQFHIDLNQSALVNSCRPSVDVMLNSIANVYGGKILVIILTGMGQDGLNGCIALKEKKDVTIVIQNKETSTVWGMPAAIYDNNLHNSCLSLLEIKNLLYAISCR